MYDDGKWDDLDAGNVPFHNPNKEDDELDRLKG